MRNFKPGDIVSFKPKNEGQYSAPPGSKAVVKGYRDRADRAGEWLVVEWLEPREHGQMHGSYYQDEFVLATQPKNKFIVCQLTKQGKLRPSTTPVIHDTQEEAEKEALRLANGGNENFAVMSIVSIAKHPDRPEATLVRLPN